MTCLANRIHLVINLIIFLLFFNVFFFASFFNLFVLFCFVLFCFVLICFVLLLYFVLFIYLFSHTIKSVGHEFDFDFKYISSSSLLPFSILFHPILLFFLFLSFWLFLINFFSQLPSTQILCSKIFKNLQKS